MKYQACNSLSSECLHATSYNNDDIWIGHAKAEIYLILKFVFTKTQNGVICPLKLQVSFGIFK